MNQLEQARKTINQVDEQMAQLFQQRMQAVEEVVAFKRSAGMATQDKGREQELIARNLTYITEEKYKESYLAFMEGMLAISRAYQDKNR